MHPRFKRRYAQVKREAGQRRLRWLTTLVTLLCLVAVTLLALYSPFLNVDRINTAGVPKEVRKKVLAASGVNMHMPLFRIHASDIEQNILSLPEVRAADVKVHWPHEVVITAQTRNAVAVIAKDKIYVPFGPEGITLNGLTTKPEEVVVISGVKEIPKPGEKAAGALAGAIAFVNGLTPATRARITKLEVQPDGTVTAEVHRQVTRRNAITTKVKLGSPIDMDAKAVALDTMLAKATIPAGMILDLQNARTPVLTYPAVTTTVPVSP